MSLRDVQSVLLSMFFEDTILMGHSLESDLRSLKVSHNLHIMRGYRGLSCITISVSRGFQITSQCYFPS